MNPDRIGEEVVGELVRLATEATEAAYAPYSKFRVGAALVTSGGKFYSGANVENRSYPLSICAERAAVVNAVTGGESELNILAVAVAEEKGGPCAPCGGCRQVIAEFCRRDALLIYRDATGTFKRVTLAVALPDAGDFFAHALGGRDAGVQDRKL